MGRRNKLPVKPLSSLGLVLPTELKEYLTEQQQVLLKCIMASYTLQDIAVYTQYPRSEIMSELMQVGRQLCVYDLLEHQVLPEDIPTADYLRGWTGCQAEIKRRLHGKFSGKALKGRNRPKTGKN